MESCNLCEAPITQGKTPHTICAKCGTLFCGECTDKNLAQCPKCGYGITTAKYTIRIKSGKGQAEKILNQIDELLVWFEIIFPSLEVSIP